VGEQISRLVVDGRIALGELGRAAARPPLFEPSRLPFWDDEHISSQMLQAHLDPRHDAASRRPETIDRTAAWLAEVMRLRPGDRLLDLGCGPGLYCTRFAQRGVRVTGIDYSRRSISYARQQALSLGLPIDYICRNYLEIEFEQQYDAAVLIFGDICTLPDPDRDRLLSKIYRALVPGGRFAFDVMTPANRDVIAQPAAWAVEPAGFWRDVPYLLLEQTLEYPGDIYLTRHFVLAESGDLAEYRIWNRLYSSGAATALAERFGFDVEWVGADLAGQPLGADCEWLGLLVRKPGEAI
jgi:SAM-dependent methyltransferase